MANTLPKSRRSGLKKIQIFLGHNSQRIAIFSGVFLLLFLGGMRFNPFGALIISLVDTLFIILLASYFDWLFSKKTFKFKTVDIIGIVFLLYAAIHLLFLIEYFIWERLFFGEIHPKRFPYVMFKDVMIILSTIIASLINYSNRQRKQAENLNFEKQAMELRFLKSQINPHFVFNVLNNIYALTYTKNDQAPDAILRLADMLRYVTDECQADTIPVEKELKYIENFIDLYVIRLGHSDNITFELDIDDYSVRIPPMIIQPIIENSFKHSDIDTNKNAKIFFSLKIKKNHLIFDTYNTKRTLNTINKPTRKGVGIANVEQRLKLYYKKGVELAINNEDEIYSLKMCIDLSKMNIN